LFPENVLPEIGHCQAPIIIIPNSPFSMHTFPDLMFCSGRVFCPSKEESANFWKQHTRHLLPDDFILIVISKDPSKADGTDFFRLLTTTDSSVGSLVPQGQYRLKTKYRRGNSTNDPNSQILKEAGNSDPENMIIDKPWNAH
jgi:hypothetical protein